MLFRNNGNGKFSDIKEKEGLRKKIGKGKGKEIEDYEKEGRKDIYVDKDKTKNLLYSNEGRGIFKEVAMQAGVLDNEKGEMV